MGVVYPEPNRLRQRPARSRPMIVDADREEGLAAIAGRANSMQASKSETDATQTEHFSTSSLADSFYRIAGRYRALESAAASSEQGQAFDELAAFYEVRAERLRRKSACGQ